MLKNIIIKFAEALVFCGPCFHNRFMYKTVQEITHPKIGITHMPTAIHTAYLTSLEGHNLVNIC